MVFDRRRDGPPGSPPSGVAPGGVDPLSAQFPLVFQFLTLERYGDGSVRVPGSLTIFWDAAVLKGCVNDKDAGLTAFVSGVGLCGVLESIEEGLRGDCLDWRAPRQKGKGKR